MYDRALRREAQRQTIVDKALEEDGVDGEGEMALRASMSTGGLGGGGGGGGGENLEAMEHKQSSQKIDIFENAFRKIKEATGVSDVNEVIQKIEGQEGTSANLMALTKENQARIEALAEGKETLKKKVEEVKYSSSGGGHRRKLVDDQEEALSTATNVLERWRSKFERFATTLISVKAGIKHLQDKMEVARDDVGGAKSELNDASIVVVLRESEDTLLTLFNRVKASSAQESAIGIVEEEDGDGDGDGDGGGGGGALPKSGAGSKMAVLTRQQTINGAAAIDHLDEAGLRENRPFNQRINLPNAGEEDFEHELEENLGDLDEEELTRDRVKKASSQILVAQDRRNKKMAKKKGKVGAQ